MILPNLRASFGSSEVDLLLTILADRAGGSRRRWDERLREDGLDSLLDKREVLSGVMEGRRVSAISPKLAFYVIVRHTLLESGLDDPQIADYIAALLLEFAVAGRAYRIARYDDKTYHYLVDVVSDLEGESSERRRFLLRAHLGNYSLWMSGMFPDYLIARVHRRGAPGLHYYEELGSTGYLLASECELASRLELARIYRQVAQGFGAVRRALNRVSDRYFLPASPTPIDRLLRQVADSTQSN